MGVQDMFIKVWNVDGNGDLAQQGRVFNLRFCGQCKTMKPKRGSKANANPFVCTACLGEAEGEEAGDDAVQTANP